MTVQTADIDYSHAGPGERFWAGRKALAVCGAWALPMAFANSAVIIFRHRRDPPRDVLLHLFLDAGQMLALGLLAGVGAYAWLKWSGRWSRLWVIPLTLASLAVGALSLPTSFMSFAERMSDSVPMALTLWTCVALGSLTIPVATFVGLRLSGLLLPVLALASALLCAVLNNMVLHRDYLGIHQFVSFCAFALGASALSGVGIPSCLGHQWIARLLLPAWVIYALAATLLPSNRMLLRLSGLEGAALAHATTALRVRLVPPADSNSALLQLSPAEREWFKSRKRVRPIPPGPRLLGENPIVLLITVDAMRADLLGRDDLKGRLPYFHNFARSSVAFDNAYSPGSKTVVSLASIFASKYYSQLYWRKWPNLDRSKRFPRLLQDSGVDTVHVACRTELLGRGGVVRGFKEEIDLDKKKRPHGNFVKSHEIMPEVRARVARQGERPLFLYTHILDPHAPYNYGELKTGSPFTRYVSEIEEFGKRMAEFDAWLEQEGLAERTTIILSADHGEAFGEHDSYRHSKTVYQEEVRVPLWVRIPGVQPRVVTEPVTLVDLGPTLLDLFGQPTPGSYMGQSLAPFLRGDSPDLSRPIAAESRHKLMLLFEGHKVIYGVADGTYELYNLALDPGEKNNIAQGGASQYELLVTAFYKAHLNRKYEKHAPFK